MGIVTLDQIPRPHTRNTRGYSSLWDPIQNKPLAPQPPMERKAGPYNAAIFAGDRKLSDFGCLTFQAQPFSCILHIPSQFSSSPTNPKPDISAMALESLPYPVGMKCRRLEKFSFSKREWNETSQVLLDHSLQQ